MYSMDQTKERCYGRTRQGAATPAKFWSQSRDKSRGRTTKHQSGVNKRRREESRAIAVPARESWRPSSAPRDLALAHRHTARSAHSASPLNTYLTLRSSTLKTKTSHRPPHHAIRHQPPGGHKEGIPSVLSTEPGGQDSSQNSRDDLRDPLSRRLSR